MNEDPLQKIKQEMDFLKNHCSLREHLLAQREQIEKQIAQLSMEFDQTLFSNQRQKSKRDHWQHISQIQQKKYQELQIKMRVLDQKLEEGEDYEEKLQQIKLVFCNIVLEKDPNKKLDYQNTTQKLEVMKKQLEETECILSFLYEVQPIFDNAVQALETKRKLLHYLFGRHPKVVVALCLFQISQEGIKFDRIVQRTPSLEHFCVKVETFFKILKKDIDKPWKNAHFEEKFKNQLKNFNLLLEELKSIKRACSEKIQKLESHLDRILG